MCKEAEEMQRIKMLGLVRQYQSINLLGFMQSAGLMVLQSQIEGRW